MWTNLIKKNPQFKVEHFIDKRIDFRLDILQKIENAEKLIESLTNTLHAHNMKGDDKPEELKQSLNLS